MPYQKTKDGRLVNEVTLGDGYPLSNDLKPFKVGGEASILEISSPLPDGSDNGKVKVRGDLEVTGGLNFKNDVEVDLSFDDLSLSGDLSVAGNADVTGNIAPSGYIELTGIPSDPGDADTVRIGRSDGLTSEILQINSNDGYLQLGAYNTNYCHFVTDRPMFYFNQDISVDTGLISSFNEDLIIRRVYNDTSYNQITLGDDSFELKLDNTARVSVDGDGNVGIGTTSPTSPLDIAGDTLVDSAGTDILLNLTQTLNSPSGDNSGVATETYSMIKGNVTNTDSAGWDNKHLLQLQTGGTDKLKSDLSGNVTSAGTITSSAGVCQGPQKYIYQASARAYTKNDYWYWPNGTYGPAYQQWNSTASASTLNSSYYDSWNPQIIVPVDMVINEYYYYGNTSGRDNTFELALRHGTGVAWDDTHNDHASMATVGTAQSGDWTSNSWNKIGETGLSVSLSAGDLLIPHHRRTTNDDTTVEYLEIVFVAVCTIS